MGEASQYGHVLPKWLQRLESLGEAIIRAFTQGEPIPLFMIRMVRRRQAYAVGKEYAAKAWGRVLGPDAGRLGHAFQHGQGQRHAGATKKCAPIQMPRFLGHVFPYFVLNGSLTTIASIRDFIW